MRKQAWVPQEGNVTECTGDAGALLQSGEDQRGITAKGNSTGPWIKKKKKSVQYSWGKSWCGLDVDSGLEHVVQRVWLWRRMSLSACERGEVFRGEPSVSAHGKLRQAANMGEVK